MRSRRGVPNQRSAEELDYVVRLHLIPTVEVILFQRVQVAHPLHPLLGPEFEFVVHGQNWGEDRCGYQKLRVGYAICEFSWIRPPSRSSVTTVAVWSVGMEGRARSGAAWSGTRCGQ